MCYQRKEDGSFDPIHILYCVINYSAVDNYDFWGTSYMVCSPIEFSTVDPTGILNIESSPSNSLRGGEPCGEPEVWYNLSGQRVSKGYKGIVVVKGKKYVIN